MILRGFCIILEAFACFEQALPQVGARELAPPGSNLGSGATGHERL